MSENRQIASPFHNSHSERLKLLKLMPNQSLKDFVSTPHEGKPMKRIISLSLFIGLAALSGCKSVNLALVPEAETKSLMTPLVEKRETITATGYAVVAVQNHKNPAQQRLMAIRASKLDAYRNLTEQVYGQQLDASSTVADMVVTNDTFRTKVEGVIYGARLVSITPVGEDTYETTLSLDKDVVQDLRVLYMSQLAAKGR
jgi:hypothetical protein